MCKFWWMLFVVLWASSVVAQEAESLVVKDLPQREIRAESMNLHLNTSLPSHAQMHALPGGGYDLFYTGLKPHSSSQTAVRHRRFKDWQTATGKSVDVAVQYGTVLARDGQDRYLLSQRNFFMVWNARTLKMEKSHAVSMSPQGMVMSLAQWLPEDKQWLIVWGVYVRKDASRQAFYTGRLSASGAWVKSSQRLLLDNEGRGWARAGSLQCGEGVCQLVWLRHHMKRDKQEQWMLTGSSVMHSQWRIGEASRTKVLYQSASSLHHILTAWRPEGVWVGVQEGDRAPQSSFLLGLVPQGASAFEVLYRPEQGFPHASLWQRNPVILKSGHKMRLLWDESSKGLVHMLVFSPGGMPLEKRVVRAEGLQGLSLSSVGEFPGQEKSLALLMLSHGVHRLQPAVVWLKPLME